MAGLVSDAVELVVDCLGSNLWMDYFGILQLTVQVILILVRTHRHTLNDQLRTGTDKGNLTV